MRFIAAPTLAIAGLLLAPAGALADTTLPNPESLRATLPDPVDGSWVEVVPGRSGFIDGPVDYAVLRTYYSYFGESDTAIQDAIDILKNAGFVGGYERQWVKRQGTDQLTERVFVFGTNSGAATAARSYTTQADAVFDPALGPGVSGWVEKLADGAAFTGVSFVRGDADYDVSIASYSPVKAGLVIAQARVLYASAPASIALSHTSKTSVFSRDLWLVALAGLTLLLGIAILVAVMTLVFLLPHRHFVPRQGAPLST